jgi:S1-C subfamily serine protease
VRVGPFTVLARRRGARFLLSIAAVAIVLPCFGVDQAVPVSYQQAVKSCVKVRTGYGVGSGVIIDAHHVLTNEHVIEGWSSGEMILPDGSWVDFEVVASDPDLDLAVLRTSSTIGEAASWGSSSLLEAGDEVAAIGYPRNLERVSVTRGIVSAPAQPVNGQDYVQTDAAINPGNSGGPLVDVAGRVVGINTFIMEDSDNMGFAVPSDRARQYIGQVLGSAPPLTGDTPDSAPQDDEPQTPEPNPAPAPDDSSPGDDGSAEESEKSGVSLGDVWCIGSALAVGLVAARFVWVYVRG